METSYNNNLLHLYSAFLGTQSALHSKGDISWVFTPVISTALLRSDHLTPDVKNVCLLMFSAVPRLQNVVVVNQLSAKFLLARRSIEFLMQVSSTNTLNFIALLAFVLLNYHCLHHCRQRNFSKWWDGSSYLGLGKMSWIPLIPCNGRDHMVLNIYMRHLIVYPPYPSLN